MIFYNLNENELSMNLSTVHRHSMNRTAHAVALSCALNGAALERETMISIVADSVNGNWYRNINTFKDFSGKFESKKNLGFGITGGEDEEE